MKKFLSSIVLFFCSSLLLFSQIKALYPLNNAVINKKTSVVWTETNQNSIIEIQLSNNANMTPITSSLSVSGIYSYEFLNLNLGDYYWQIRTTNGTDTSWTAIRKFTIVNIDTISGLLTWFKPDSGFITNTNNKISEWRGINNVARQNIEAYKPTLNINSLNGFSSVDFDGQDDNLLFNRVLGIRDAFLVVQHKTGNQNYTPILGDDIIQPEYHGGTTTRLFNTTYTNPKIVNGIIRVNSNTVSVSTVNKPINKSIVSIFATDSVQASTIAKDRYFIDRSWNGSYNEIILFSNSLDSTNRFNIEHVLKYKYTPYPYLGKDTIVCGPSIKIGFRKDHAYSSRIWSTGETNVDSITITQNGTYWVTVNSFGIVLKDTINITGIVPPPTISLTNDQTICYGDSIQVNYTPVAGFSPTWSTGATTNQITVKDSSVFVQLTHRDANNCYASSDIFFVKVDSLSLLSTIGDDRNICDGGQIYATSTGEGPFNYSWSTGDTTSFTIPPTLGSQDISIEMSNFNNCYFRDTISVNALNLPAPNVAFEYDTACPNKISQFTDLSTPGGTDNIIDWNWKFINNDTSDAQNPSYIFSEGTFSVSLTVETDSGCVNTLIKPYKSHRQPHATINSLIPCAESSSMLSNNSTIAIPDVINNYNWTIGTQNYAGSSPQVAFPTEGLQDVTLIVTSNRGCTDTTTKTIEVYPALLPDFEIDNVCIGDSTTFTDITPSYSTISRLWNFGGGQFSTDTMPTILFTDTGTYSVTLQVENAIGCQNSITKTVKINSLPIASATIDNICENSLSLFYNTSNTTTNNFEWLINSVPYTSDSVLLSFNTAGNYPVYHKITDINGCEDDTSFNFTIRPNPNVNFNFNPTFGQAPLLVNFENETDSAILNTWNFGENNQQSNDVNPSYTYTENGVYNVTLIAENQYGCRDSMLKIINVSPTELDVELSNLDYQIITLANGDMAYIPQLTLSNVGTRTIYNIDIYVSIDEEKNISEHWQGTLNVGESMQYIFQSYFIIPDEANINYMCAEAKNTNDDTEDLLSNNKSCIILNGKLKTSKIYPNPTNNNANIDIISKNKGNINVGVYDMAGKKVYTAENIAIQKGYNQLVIDCVHLQIGKYIVNITHQGEIYQLTFWVNH
ncbi:MAG: PKD domain-containing protein [Chitinophagales bacterium]|nr:PKD domain-containing protein [Chitinophagales bacterium]